MTRFLSKPVLRHKLNMKPHSRKPDIGHNYLFTIFLNVTRSFVYKLLYENGWFLPIIYCGNITSNWDQTHHSPANFLGGFRVMKVAGLEREGGGICQAQWVGGIMGGQHEWVKTTDRDKCQFCFLFTMSARIIKNVYNRIYRININGSVESYVSDTFHQSGLFKEDL